MVSSDLDDSQTAGTRYHLSDSTAYAATIREELHDRTNESVVEILDTSPPQAMTDLFAGDVCQFFETELARAMSNGKTRDEALTMLAALQS